MPKVTSLTEWVEDSRHMERIQILGALAKALRVNLEAANRELAKLEAGLRNLDTITAAKAAADLRAAGRTARA